MAGYTAVPRLTADAGFCRHAPIPSASSGLETSWIMASLEAWAGTTRLFPEKSILLSSSTENSLERKTSNETSTATRSEELSPSRLCWQTDHF